MKSWLLAALLLLPAATFANPSFATPLPPPAAPGAMAPSLSRTPDGTPLLSWAEPADAQSWQLRFSRFDPATNQFSAATTIAHGSGWLVNWADVPTLTPLSEETWMAVWSVENPSTGHGHGAGRHHGAGYHAVYSLTHDAGKTWSAPQRTSGESNFIEFVAVHALGQNSRALVAWLDGRQRHSGGPDQQALYSQTLLASGADQLVDARVCDCCPLSFATIPDGALLAYRGRDADETRDMRVVRWRNHRWEKPQSLHADHWQIKGCPVNGPRLASHESNVAAVWYTAAQDQPRVQVKFSTDAGDSWGHAFRVDLGRPQGRVDCLLRADGSALITWLESTGADSGRTGGIYLRAVRSDGSMSEPRLIAATRTSRASGIPRLAPLADGRVLLAYTVDEESTRIATLLLNPI